MDELKKLVKDLIVKKIAREFVQKNDREIMTVEGRIKFIITRWEEEKAKNEGLK
jgi:hypothetical protein